MLSMTLIPLVEPSRKNVISMIASLLKKSAEVCIYYSIVSHLRNYETEHTVGYLDVVREL